jgi:hypothetical protein
MMAAMVKLHPLLQKKGGTSWHLDQSLFPSGKEGPQGVLNISPAWFEQGHEVRHSITQNIYFQQLISIETVQISPQVSKVLRQTHGSDWLDCIS